MTRLFSLVSARMIPLPGTGKSFLKKNLGSEINPNVKPDF